MTTTNIPLNDAETVAFPKRDGEVKPVSGGSEGAPKKPANTPVQEVTEGGV